MVGEDGRSSDFVKIYCWTMLIFKGIKVSHHLNFFSILNQQKMEIYLVSVTVTVLVALTLRWAWKIFNWVWLKPRRLEKCLREQGLAGNSYRILSGDMKEYSQMRIQAKSKPANISDDIVPRVIPFIIATINKYGKDNFIWFGPMPKLHILDPELIKEVLIKIHDFRKPDNNSLFRLLANGLVSHDGDKWTRHRKIINPAFHQEKLRLMLPAFQLSSTEIINKWKKLISEGGSSEVDVWPYLQTLASDVISRTAFGSSYEQGRRIFQLQSEQTILVMRCIQSVYIPGWRFLPTKINRRMKEIEREVRFLLRGLINKREKDMKAGEVASNDLLGILVESNMKEIHENNGDKNVGMSIEDVIEECKLFYFAGQETASVLLVWTIILLSKHQEWQTRARDEVLQIFGKEKPDIDGLSRLKIVTMILYEVLRLYPPFVLLTRTVHTEVKLGDMLIPPGVQVSIPTILVQQDYELWGFDAKEFKPERFSEGVSKVTKNQISFIPFGWGPRVCIGQHFSLIEAKVAVAMILQHFWLELSPSYVHAPHTVITLQPEHGAHIILHKL